MIISPAISFNLLEKNKQISSEILEYSYISYRDLYQKRLKKKDEISKSLKDASFKKKSFSNWFRCLKYRYSNTPLSVIGSLENREGGRFNIGSLDQSKFSPFPCLYLSEDKKTAEIELLSKEKDNLNTKSTSTVSCSFQINSYIDLREIEKLKSFLDIIKKINYSKKTKDFAKKIKLPESCAKTIDDLDSLSTTLQDENWRFNSWNFGIPAPVQVFGQLVYESKIEGILFKSNKNSKLNIAIFTRNLKKGSFIKLDDKPPTKDVIKKIDHTNFRKAEQKVNT